MACAITLVRTPCTWAAMACLFAGVTVPLAPEVPSVIAVFSEVTTALMDESAVSI